MEEADRERELILLSEKIKQSEALLRVACWRLGGELSTDSEELDYVSRTFASEEVVKISGTKFNVTFRLKTK